MAVWICWNFTKPSPVRNSPVTASITIIRLAMSNPLLCSAADVQEHPAVDAVPVPVFLSEEGRRLVLRPDGDEAVVAAQAPSAGVPVHAAADVARQERLVLIDGERTPLVERQAADAGGDVRHDRAGRSRHHEVAAVVEQVR